MLFLLIFSWILAGVFAYRLTFRNMKGLDFKQETKISVLVLCLLTGVFALLATILVFAKGR